MISVFSFAQSHCRIKSDNFPILMCRPTVNWALENCKFRRLSHFLSACLHFPLHHHRLLRARITWKTSDAKKWSSSFPGHRVRTRKEPRAVETRSLLDEEWGNFAVRPAHAQHGKGQRSSHQQPAAPYHDASLSVVIDQKSQPVPFWPRSASALLDLVGAFKLGAGTDQWVRNHKKAPHKTDGQTLLQNLYSANVETLIPISPNYMCKGNN